MQFSITASGAPAAAIQQLEAQRDTDHPHSSLKGGVIDHLIEHMEELEDEGTADAVSISVSVSINVTAASSKASAAD